MGGVTSVRGVRHLARRAYSTKRTIIHDPARIFSRRSTDNGSTALIILNNSGSRFLSGSFPTVRRLWGSVKCVVCADGGSNHLYRFCSERGELDHYIPHAICGDLDSINDEVKTYYSSKGTSIVQNTDQDSTDMQKCLRLVQTKHSVRSVLICGGLGGRFDHEMGNINTLHKTLDGFDEVVLFDESNLVQLLGAGDHEIRVDPAFIGPHCGLIPFGRDGARITTQGLRWDMDGMQTEFGGLVSTSNQIATDLVKVQTSHPVVWTTELRHAGDAATPPPRSSL